MVAHGKMGVRQAGELLMDSGEFKAIEDAFIQGFRDATDKAAFQRLAHLPLELDDGGKLIEIVGRRTRIQC